MTIDDYGDAINALVNHDIPLRDVIAKYRDIALAKSMPGDIYDVPKPTLDPQTHKDVVELIEKAISCDGPVYESVDLPERLACVIEGRMGYETPQKTIISNLPTTPWRRGQTGGQVELQDSGGNTIIIYEGMDEHMNAFLKLCIAAPDLVEKLHEIITKFFHDDDYTSMSDFYSLMRESVCILQKAGVDI